MVAALIMGEVIGPRGFRVKEIPSFHNNGCHSGAIPRYLAFDGFRTPVTALANPATAG